MKKTILPLIVAVAGLTLLYSAGEAQAARITIGSPLTAAFAPNRCDEAACTVVTTGSPDPATVIESSVDGMIVAWHIREGSASYKYALRVITPGAGLFTGAGTSAAVSPLGPGVETFRTALPIHVGQEIGIDLEAEAPIGFAPAGTYIYYKPPLADGQSLANTAVLPGELAFNAEILPAPTITSLDTISGPTGGGTSVSITGTDFEEVEGVSFGSIPAAYKVESQGLIRATAPTAAAGSVPVTVRTVAGSATSSQAFTFLAPPPSTPDASPSTTSVTCKVPRLKGRSLKGARGALRRAHCGVGHVGHAKGSHTGAERVVSQKPRPGTVRGAGSTVAIKLGSRVHHRHQAGHRRHRHQTGHRPGPTVG